MARRLSFILPADWWRIPLVNEEARTVNIDHMVDHQFHNIDEAAQLRHDLKEELYKQASEAAQIGGIVMAFYLLNLDGTPVSATMACYDLTGLMSLPSELNPAIILSHYVGDKELEDSLPTYSESLFPDGFPQTQTDLASETAESVSDVELEQIGVATSDEPQIPWTKITDYDILAYRREEITSGSDYFKEETPKTEQLRVTYAQVVPDFGLVQTVFSTPLVRARESWIQMWDAMIASFRADTSNDQNISDRGE